MPNSIQNGKNSQLAFHTGTELFALHQAQSYGLFNEEHCHLVSWSYPEINILSSVMSFKRNCGSFWRFSWRSWHT